MVPGTCWVGFGRAVVLAVAAWACSAADGPAKNQGPATSPTTFVGRAFVFELDAQAAAEAGAGGGDGAAALLDRAAAVLVRRLRASGRFAEATVALEPGSRLVVTFVGDQPAATESMLIDGLARPARVELRAEPSAGDLRRAGSSREEERGRLAAWRRLHPAAPLDEFTALPPGRGGASEGFEWLPSPGGELLVVTAPGTRHALASEEHSLTVTEAGEGGYALGLELAHAAHEALRSVEPKVGLVALEGRVVGRWSGALPRSLPLGVHRGAAARALVFALGGGALPAPLAFVERTTRPLGNVRTR